MKMFSHSLPVRARQLLKAPYTNGTYGVVRGRWLITASYSISYPTTISK